MIYLADNGAQQDLLYDPRDAPARPAHGLRDQVAGRRLDALLLGRELRPDLSRAEPPRGPRPDRGERGRLRRPPAQGLRADGGRARRRSTTGSPPPSRCTSSCATRACSSCSSPTPSTPTSASSWCAAMREEHERVRDELRGSRSQGRRERGRGARAAPVVLRVGDRLQEFIIDWCDRMEREIATRAAGRELIDVHRDRASSSIAVPAGSWPSRLAVGVVAGALGGGVADRLDPYGADDPATESVARRAAARARAACNPAVDVVALVRTPERASLGRRRQARSRGRARAAARPRRGRAWPPSAQAGPALVPATALAPTWRRASGRRTDDSGRRRAACATASRAARA